MSVSINVGVCDRIDDFQHNSAPTNFPLDTTVLASLRECMVVGICIPLTEVRVAWSAVLYINTFQLYRWELKKEL